MPRCGSLLLLLAWATTLQAQTFEELQRSPQMVEAFDGKTLVGWEIEGEHNIQDGVLVIGGKAEAKLRPKVLGDQFGFYAEWKTVGGLGTVLHFRHPSSTTHRSWSPLDGEQWQALALFNDTNGSGRHHHLRYERRSDGGAGSGSISGGSEVISDLEIVIRAGTQLSIRKLRWFSPPPPPPPSKTGLYIAMGVLGVLLAGAMFLGWLLNRRRTATSTGT